MRFTAVIAAICVLAISAFGQRGTISGSLTSKDGKPLINTIVKIQRNTDVIQETSTDSEGKYAFANVTDGTYDVVYSDENNKVVVERISIRNGYDVSRLSTRIVSETVTVSAAASQPIEQVSKTVDVISAQEMRDRADFSLVETLRTIPGFRVSQLGGFGRTATIKTRGLRNQDTAILVDGIRFRDASAITGDASPFLSDFTLTSVAKIEVMRGSGSSLYGTNAIGGTVDFQTPRPQSGTHGQISGAFGGLGLSRFRGNVSHGMANGKFGIGAGISRTVYTKGIDGQDNASNTNFQSRIEFNPFSKTSISARIFVSDANVRLNSGPDTLGTLPASNAVIINAVPTVSFLPDVNDPDSFQKSRFFSGQLAVNQVINRRLVLSGYFQGLLSKRTNENGVLGAGFQSASTSVFDGTVSTGNIHVNWTPAEQNELTVGYEFEAERFGNDGKTPSGTGNFFTRTGQSSNTFYIQDLVRLLNGKLQLAGGFRSQIYKLDRPSFSLANAPYRSLALVSPPTAYTFDGSASYYVAKTGTKFRAHAGNGYRVPSLYERFGSFYSSFGTPSFIAIGDPFLKPEKTIAFDAGIEQNLAGDKLRLTATYFYTRLTDIIGYGNTVPNIGTTPRPYGGYINQKGGIARGGEFSSTLKPTRSTDVFASYTFTNSVQRTPQVSGSQIIKTLGVPEHQFTLTATQRFRQFWVNFDLVATSSYLAPIFSNSNFSTYVYRFNGNRKGDLTAGYTFRIGSEMSLRLYGTIENIFDQEYYENGFRTAKRTGRIGLTFGF